MATLKDICGDIMDRFEAMDKAREGALAASRKVTRNSGDSIKAIHRGEWAQAERLMAETRDLNSFFSEMRKDFPEIFYSGYVEDAQVEFAEMSILYTVLKGEPLPTPGSLMVGSAA